jgi:uncharacterized protein
MSKGHEIQLSALRQTRAREGVASNHNSPTLQQKVEFLSRPEAYIHVPEQVVVRETHMSWVFMAGNRVYKLKKPVRFPYLDFSTLARREATCRAELRLNRRLAFDVYLGVMPLTAILASFSLPQKFHFPETETGFGGDRFENA